MPDIAVRILRSSDELRAIAPAWNDLRKRSGPTLPTSRAELVALWCEHFAADQPLAAIVIEQWGQLVAALPLVERRHMGVKVAVLTGDDWSPSGDLLLDRNCQVDRVCDALVDGLRQTGCSLGDFGAVIHNAARWQSLLAALARKRVALARRQQCRVNVVSVQPDWPGYFASRSRNHRRHIRRALAHAMREGPLELVCHDHPASGEMESLLKTCFEIEASGWKGRSQSAVLSVPGAREFYVQQARLLAAVGELNVLVLEHAGKPIAFEYGWVADGIYYSLKVGYDEAFGRYAPGQLLRALWIERLCGGHSIRTVDFLGSATPATSCWATDDYGVDRVVAALGGPIGRAAVELYRGAWHLSGADRRRAGAGARPPRLGDHALTAADEAAEASAAPAERH